MELKNAAAVCLISFFSATLVLLIARALDLQTASRLEAQLAKIVEQLEAMRGQSELPKDVLTVYYFHSNTRCPTCNVIESQSDEVVRTEFAAELESGAMAWKVLNYEEPAGSELAETFEIQMPVVVLVRRHGGQVEDWKRLDEVWALVADKPAFADYLVGEIKQMLKTPTTEPPATPTVAAPEVAPLDIPIPGADPSNIPVPDAAPADIPVPDPDTTDIPILGDPPTDNLAPDAASDIPVPADIPVPQ